VLLDSAALVGVESPLVVADELDDDGAVTVTVTCRLVVDRLAVSVTLTVTWYVPADWYVCVAVGWSLSCATTGVPSPKSKV